jgi:nucleoside 2-deoxyribosyltransferase
MKIVYVAGPFRGATAWEVAENVRIAERAGLAVARVGFMPLIPHANTAHFHGECTDEFWLSGTMELMRRCDAVLVVYGWGSSAGTLAEMAEAERVGIPVFKNIDDLTRGLTR